MIGDGEFVAVLLTGGKSRRMGEDKAYLPFGRQPLWEHQLGILEALNPAGTILSSRASQQFPEKSGVAVVADEEEGSGALAALPKLFDHFPRKLPRLLIPVDMPCLSPEFLRAYYLEKATADVGIAYQVEADLQPLPLLLPEPALTVASEMVSENQLSLRKFCQRLASRELLKIPLLDNSHRQSFANANSPEEWETFRQPPLSAKPS